MKLDRGNLQQRLEPCFFNSSTVDEVVEYILALEPRWQEFVFDWVLSVAKTQPEISYQFATKGWINIAQREALILLAEALSSLDDRYAIYGFSGNTRKRCEIYKIKTFDETYDEEIRARIAAIYCGLTS